MEISYIPLENEITEENPCKIAVVLGDTEFIFLFQYNPSDQAFFYDIYDSEEDPIVEGRKLVLGGDMLSGIVDERIPSGIQVISADLTGEAEISEVNLDNFGKTVNLYIIGG